MGAQGYTQNRWWNRIRFRLLLFASIMSVVPLLIIAWFNLSWFNKNMEANLHHQQTLIGTRIASEVKKTISEVENSLDVFLACQRKGLLLPGCMECESNMYTVINKMPSVESLAFADATGQEVFKVCKYNVIFPKDLVNVGDTEAFKATREFKTYYGDARLGSARQPVFTMAIPVRNDGAFAGALFVTVSLRSVIDEIAAHPLGNGGYIFLVNEKKELIGHQDFSQVLKKQDVSMSLPVDFGGYSGNDGGSYFSGPVTNKYLSYSGLQVLGTYSVIDRTNWGIIIEQPFSEAMLPFTQLKGFWMVGTGLIILVVLSVSFFFGIKFSRDLEDLESGVNKLAKGYLGYQLKVPGDNELGNVVRAFNNFSIELRKKREMEKAMAEVDKMAAVGLLASGVAHEVNNPMGTIQLIVEDLIESVNDKNEGKGLTQEQLNRKLKIIQEQIMRCTKITNGLLGFSRKKESTEQLIDINGVLKDTARLLEFQMKKKKVNLQFKLNSDLPMIYLDEQGLQQVIFNLLTNALDAIQKDSGKITLISNYIDSGWLSLEIEDDGMGIESENLERVFEPFFSTKPVGQGTGLGLSICYGIVTGWGGKITIASKLGIGTKVTVLLPLKQDINQDNTVI
ncbi:MAG: ATP-binding protein [Bacillota bacterium]